MHQFESDDPVQSGALKMDLSLDNFSKYVSRSYKIRNFYIKETF